MADVALFSHLLISIFHINPLRSESNDVHYDVNDVEFDVVDVTISVFIKEVLTFPIGEHQDYINLLIFEV